MILFNKLHIPIFPVCMYLGIEYTGDKCSNIEPFITTNIRTCMDRLVEEYNSDSSCKFFVYRAWDSSGNGGTCLLKINIGNQNPNSNAKSGRIPNNVNDC